MRVTPAEAVGKPDVVSVTTILIAINVVVYLLDPILARLGIFAVQNYQTPFGVEHVPGLLLHTLGSFTLYDFIFRAQFYRLITFQFLHANLTHLVMNMFALYIFGPLVEDYLGRWRYLRFYLLCGIGGPLLYTVLSLLHLLGGGLTTPLVGASAGIFGVLVAAAIIAPDATVLIYGVLPMRLRTMAWLLLAIAAGTVILYGQSARYNAGGQAAHLGGAAIGWLLVPTSRTSRRPAIS